MRADSAEPWRASRAFWLRAAAGSRSGGGAAGSASTEAAQRARRPARARAWVFMDCLGTAGRTVAGASFAGSPRLVQPPRAPNGSLARLVLGKHSAQPLEGDHRVLVAGPGQHRG